MFQSSHPFLLFDHYRVPYRVASGNGHGETNGSTKGAPPSRRSPWECGTLNAQRRDGSAAIVRWPVLHGNGHGQAGVLPMSALQLGTVPAWGRIVPDRLTREWLGESDGAWSPVEPVAGAGGRVVASVWRDASGNLFLPFDPSELIHSYWSEAYQDVAKRAIERRLQALILRAYYRTRPALPRHLQIRARRLYSRRQARTSFPRWPAETALHELYQSLFRQIGGAVGNPIPHLASWPDGHSWSLVLTHDVETAAGYDAIALMRDVELEAGYRSSWNLVPEGYDVNPALVHELGEAGFEVGVHGLRHDGRDFSSAAVLEERLVRIRSYAARWQATGYRSPSTLRVWDRMPGLGFDYDSSYSDTAPFEPQPGGCCSMLPYFNQDLVELPITLPQDHTLFVILGHDDESLWLQKAALIKAQKGMALLLTHPDYATPPRLDAYRRFLEAHASDSTVWRALPREVSAWWRSRAASRLERSRDGWRIVGPASERGRILFT